MLLPGGQSWWWTVATCCLLINSAYMSNLNGPGQKPSFLRSFSNTKKTEGGGQLTHRLPDAVVAGVAKCGTTALITMLGSHPGVAAAEGQRGGPALRARRCGDRRARLSGAP